MLTSPKVAILAALVLTSASQALARDAGIPNIDLEKLCRAAEGAISEIYGTVTVNTFDSCMNDEKRARGVRHG